MAEQTEDLNELEAQRRAKLAELREQGQAYPNTFRPQTTNDRIVAQFGDDDADALAARAPVKIAGRMMTRRVMGKASFAHLQDVGGRMQVYFRADSLPDGVYDEFKKWDIGDIVGVEGTLFRTKTGELSVRASSAELVVKGLRPLPEKWHGLSDQETRYRQRYVDLIVTDKSRDVFRTRSRIIEYIRQYFLTHDFLEVETPMMQVIPGGAVARPFETHHNALDMKLYLRIAPELYLKRLLVGGFERVFEINRNFRNEGVSVRHNPEFTMLEYYQAYADVFDAMDHTEQLFRGIAEEVVGSHAIQYQGEGIDFGPAFERLRLKDSLLKFNPQLSEADLDDDKRVADFARSIGVAVEPHYGRGKIWFEIFEKTVEANLRDPTFITHYPTEVSPLSRANDDDSFVTDRFEFFVGGRELANGFSELNDPEDQAERFRAQVASRDAGDDEAMYFDADYIRALEVGMPPAAGEGIGIDRLVMLFTDSASIRDVLLFPHMRPEF